MFLPVLTLSTLTVFLIPQSQLIGLTQARQTQDNSSVITMGEPTEIAEIEYEQLASDVETGRVIVVDVRNPDELLSQGKIPGSINIPLPQVPDVWNNLTAEEFQERYGFSKSDPGKPLVFTCRAGTRAKAAIDNLLALGFTNEILLYKGSFTDWLQKGGKLAT